MRGSWKEAGRALFDPLVTLLVRLGVTPNQITWNGFIWSLLAGGAAGLGRLRLAGFCLILSALCDLLDGQVARRTGRAGPVGAFLDSSLDRVAEAAVFLGLIIHYRESPVLMMVTGTALVASFMVSYARARAEGLGYDCSVGLMERPERLILLIILLFMSGTVLQAGLCVIALLSIVTFIQRFRHVIDRAANSGDAEDQRPQSRAQTGFDDESDSVS